MNKEFLFVFPYIIRERQIFPCCPDLILYWSSLRLSLNLNSQTFWHISKGTFYRKQIKFLVTIIFTIKNRLVFCIFQQIEWIFGKKKCDRASILRRFCSIFPSKPPIFGDVSELIFDRKCIKIIDILNFIIENRTAFAVFLLNQPIFGETDLKWAFASIFG